MTDQPTFMNAVQAASALGLTRRTLIRRIENGQIEASKLGTGRTSAYVITADEIERVKAGEPA